MAELYTALLGEVPRGARPSAVQALCEVEQERHQATFVHHHLQASHLAAHECAGLGCSGGCRQELRAQ